MAAAVSALGGEVRALPPFPLPFFVLSSLPSLPLPIASLCLVQLGLRLLLTPAASHVIVRTAWYFPSLSFSPRPILHSLPGACLLSYRHGLSYLDVTLLAFLRGCVLLASLSLPPPPIPPFPLDSFIIFFGLWLHGAFLFLCNLLRRLMPSRSSSDDAVLMVLCLAVPWSASGFLCTLLTRQSRAITIPNRKSGLFTGQVGA